MEEPKYKFILIAIAGIVIALILGRRRRPAPGVKRIVLRPGYRLETAAGVITALRRPVSTEITCNCTEAEPDTPDCERSVTIDGPVIRVSCTPIRGCTACSQTIRVPSLGLVLQSTERVAA